MSTETMGGVRQRTVSGARTQDHATTQARARQAAGTLQALGIDAGDAVALLLRNDFPFFEAGIGASMLGAYTVPINWHATSADIGHILADCGAKVLIGHADLLAGLGEQTCSAAILSVPTPMEIASAYGVSPGSKPDLATYDWNVLLSGADAFPGASPTIREVMLYTSGTTGRPKGVRRRVVDGQGSSNGYGLKPGSRMSVLINGPMYHAAPNAYAQLALRFGAEIVLQPRFDAEELLALVQRYRITHMHLVPIMMHRLLRLEPDVRARYDLSSLVDVVHGAAPCPISVKRDMIAWWGAVISEYYGSSETGLITRLEPGEALGHPGSVGRPRPGVELRILGENGEELGSGEVGEIFIRSAGGSDFTYHNQPGERLAVERQGFVTVGDVGFLDAEGFLYLSDRKRDMIISGGVNIFPSEIEAALMSLVGVKDCAVFGAPDGEYGERIIACVQADPAIDLGEADVRRHLARSIAKYKMPREIVFLKDLPRDDSGKILKRRLREPYWAGSSRAI